MSLTATVDWLYLFQLNLTVQIIEKQQMLIDLAQLTFLSYLSAAS